MCVIAVNLAKRRRTATRAVKRTQRVTIGCIHATLNVALQNRDSYIGAK